MATSVSKLLISLTKFSGKVSKVIDATDSFNSSGSYYQDVSGWDVIVAQIVSPSEAISFKATNDDGSITGQLLPAPEVPVNWSTVEGINLATKTDVSSVNATAMISFGIVGKYLQFLGTTVATPYSYAYVIAKPVENINEAYGSALSNGTNIVYAAAGSEGSVTKFYSDSELTQPIYGNGVYWYGYKLLAHPEHNTYACTISSTGVVNID